MKAKTRRAFAAMIITAFAAFAGLPSCSTFTGDSVLIPGINLPVEIGLQYRLEDGLWIQVLPGAKGGLEVTLVGEGQMTESIKKIPGGFEILSPLTGLVYQITQGASGKPRITIIGGIGRLQPIPIADNEPEPPDVQGTPDPPAPPIILE